MAVAAAATVTLATLFRDGNYLGRVDADDSVLGVRGKIGTVNASAEVRSPEDTLLGTADESGFLLSPSGDMCGIVDASGSVWAGDELLGQVMGTDIRRGAAALLFLLRDEPSLSLAPESVADEDSLVRSLPRREMETVRAIAPKPRSNRFAFAIAHLVVLVGLILGGWTLIGWGLNTYRGIFPFRMPAVAGAPGYEAARASIIAAEKRDAAIARRFAAEDAAWKRMTAAVTAQYVAMDAAYNRRDTEGFYKYHAPDFQFVNKDGATDNLRQSKRYMNMRLSRTHPKRFLSCSISQRVSDILYFDKVSRSARVDQTVFTVTLDKGKVRTEIKQEDIWRNDRGHWRCVRSQILSRSATPL